jgi:hypothetical protein
MTFNDIELLIRNEFGSIAEHFYRNNLSLTEAKDKTNTQINRPGVYILWTGDRVIKVGRHLVNARSRLEGHYRDDTGGKCKALEKDPAARVFLYTLANKDELHWACALEVFLERAVDPLVRSKRTG